MHLSLYQIAEISSFDGLSVETVGCGGGRVPSEAFHMHQSSCQIAEISSCGGFALKAVGY